MSSSKSKPVTRGKKRPKTRAERADRHRLYQKSVQCVEAEIDFVEKTFRKRRGRRPKRFREDFCGTANAACEWVKRRRTHQAVGIDLDGEVLDWGRTHNLARLKPGPAKRIELIHGNVLTTRIEPVDVAVAMNFSYWTFKERKTLKRYFRRVNEGLVSDGLFILDAYGGHDAFRVMKDRHRYNGFTYVWDQADYDPITGDYTCHIHFNFADGSRMRRAFTYHWRLWTLPEIQECLRAAGFQTVQVYWQGFEEKSGEADGDFLPTDRGDPDPAWIAYLVAEK